MRKLTKTMTLLMVFLITSAFALAQHAGLSTSNVAPDFVAKPEAREIGNSTISGITTHYESGSSNVVVQFQTYAYSGDDEYVVYGSLDFPAGVEVLSATNMGTLPWNSEMGDGALTTWGFIPFGWGAPYLWNQTVNFTVTVNFGALLSGDLTIGWFLHGDDYGAQPHSASGSIVLQEGAPPPPPPPPPPVEIVEDEPCGALLNDGCNMPSGTEAFEQVNYGDIFYGKTCTYIGSTGNNSRDTDWFELVLTEPRLFVLYAEADAPMYFFLLGPNHCSSVGVVELITASQGNPGEMDLGILPAGTYWFWAGLQDFSGYPDDINYVMYFGEKPLPVIPVSNWALYLGILLMVSFVVIRFRRMM